MQIQQIDPQKLKVHPLLKHVPDEWADDENPEFVDFRQNIQQNGIVQPLLVAGDKIVDGRRRWRAANLLDIRSVPMILVDESQVASIIVASSLRRSYNSKSHRAYSLFFVFEPAYKEALARHQERLKSGNQGDHLDKFRNGPTVTDIARQSGCSRDYMDDAAKVHELFAADAELKQQCEPQILSGDCTLGAVIAGAAGKNLKGQKRPANKPFYILERAAVGVINQIEALDELTKRDDRDEFRRFLSDRFLDFRKFDAAKCNAAAKRFRTLAKEFEFLAKRAGKNED